MGVPCNPAQLPAKGKQPPVINSYLNSKRHYLIQVRPFLAMRLIPVTASSLMRASLAVLSLIAWLSVSPAHAQAPAAKPPAPTDYIVFKNGDKLTGTLVRSVGTDLTFKSDNVGEVTISIDKVQEVHSQGAFVVIKKDERLTRTTKQPGKLTFSDGTLTVADTKTGVETVPVADLGYILDQATFTKEITSNPGPFQGWNGAITGGATVLQSSTYGQTLTAGISLIRAIPSVSFLPPRTRTTFNLLQTYGKLTQPVIPQTVPPTPASVAKTNIFHTDFEHDKFLTDRFFLLGGLSYDHNYSQGLDLQQVYGVGAGYTVLKDSLQELDFRADIHYERQNFVQNPPPEISTPNQDLIGSSFGESYRRTLPAKILLTQSAVFNQSWNNLHAYSFTGALGLAMPVYHRFSLSMNILNNYLNNPAFGYQKNSFQFITGITYTLH
jgi:Protein of unknown function, DUF481